MEQATDDWFEKEYNPRASVADAPAIIADWAARAEAFRAGRPPRTIAYGAHPRETFDVFDAAQARGAFVFIHGGYWRALSKDLFSWIAPAFLDERLSVVVVNYPLCPEATLRGIVGALRAALAALGGEALPPTARRLVLGGHSAGGYLTAAMLATDWGAIGLDPPPVAGALPISGIFDLPPLLRTSMNAEIGLTLPEARALSLVSEAPRLNVPLTLAYGGAEPRSFHQQSEDLAVAWSELRPKLLAIEGRHHFDVIEGLADPSSRLFAAAKALAPKP